MRHYELVVVLIPTLSQEEALGARARIKQFITQREGGITREEPWGMRRLAYPIRKGGQTFLEGNYLLTYFSANETVPVELETQLRLSEDVLRFLVVKSEEPVPAPPLPEEAVATEAEAPQALEQEPAVPQAQQASIEEAIAPQEEPQAEERPATQAEGPQITEEVATPQAEEPRPVEAITSQAEEPRDRQAEL